MDGATNGRVVRRRGRPQATSEPEMHLRKNGRTHGRTDEETDGRTETAPNYRPSTLRVLFNTRSEFFIKISEEVATTGNVMHGAILAKSRKQF